MASPLVPHSFYQQSRKSDLLHISHIQVSGDYEYFQNVQSLRKAQIELFDDDPELQKNALKVIICISNKYGFAKGSLPPLFFQRIKDLIFGNHASIEVVQFSLELVESLVEMSQWTIDSFLQMDLPTILFGNIQQNDIGVPADKICFILNSLLYHNSEAYSKIISLGYYNKMINLAKSDLSKADALWVLVSIQSITSSPFFNENDSLHEIVQIALKYFELANKAIDLNILSLVYFLFGRCLASFELLNDQEIQAITNKNIIQQAYFIVEKKMTPNIVSILNYIQNYIYYNNENTMTFISLGFVPLFYKIFTKCDTDVQIELLNILNNAAVEPLESTLEILKSPISTDYIPGMLDNASLSLKKAAISLVLTLIVKVPLFSQYKVELPQSQNQNDSQNANNNQNLNSNQNPEQNHDPNTNDKVFVCSGDIIFKLVQNTFRYISDLLVCEDDEIIRYCLQVFHHLITEMQILKPVHARIILNMFNCDIKESLYDLVQCNNEILSGLSMNVIKSLDILASKISQESQMYE